MGIRFTTWCWANVHRVDTDQWSVSYSAVNSLDGWNYRVTAFRGSLERFRQDIAMVRMIS